MVLISDRGDYVLLTNWFWIFISMGGESSVVAPEVEAMAKVNK